MNDYRTTVRVSITPAWTQQTPWCPRAYECPWFWPDGIFSLGEPVYGSNAAPKVIVAQPYRRSAVLISTSFSHVLQAVLLIDVLSPSL